jgi:hypothetical protein
MDINRVRASFNSPRLTIRLAQSARSWRATNELNKAQIESNGAPSAVEGLFLLSTRGKTARSCFFGSRHAKPAGVGLAPTALSR